jgi:uncharacterized protein YjbI with pentapeptide repeats
MLLTASLRRAEGVTIPVRIAAVIIAAELLFAIWWWVGLPGWLMIATAIALAPPLVYGAWWLWWRLTKSEVNQLALKIRDPKARADVEDNFRKTAGQLIGGAAVLIGAGFALFQFLQQQQTTQSQFLQQQRTTQSQFLQQQQAAHDLLISNQVSKAFEQLASDKIAMRLGGIYALEGVMNTSEQYHGPVLEALCAFVRESTIGKTAPDKPATDVQAALTVIGRRIKGPGAVDLANANIPKADLHEANLISANLRGANLGGANLISANLRGANLINANLSDANLIDANLTANLSDANLSGADLRYANLTSNLSDANLSGADLRGANLNNAYLGSANLSGAHLFRANLGGANLGRANLISANLSGAHLSGANLSDANLSGADLRDDLGVVVGLTQTQLDEACGDANTKPPEGFTRPKLCPPPRVP